MVEVILANGRTVNVSPVSKWSLATDDNHTLTIHSGTGVTTVFNLEHVAYFVAPSQSRVSESESIMSSVPRG